MKLIKSISMIASRISNTVASMLKGFRFAIMHSAPIGLDVQGTLGGSIGLKPQITNGDLVEPEA